MGRIINGPALPDSVPKPIPALSSSCAKAVFCVSNTWVIFHTGVKVWTSESKISTCSLMCTEVCSWQHFHHVYLLLTTPWTVLYIVNQKTTISAKVHFNFISQVYLSHGFHVNQFLAHRGYTTSFRQMKAANTFGWLTDHTPHLAVSFLKATHTERQFCSHDLCWSRATF